MTHYEIELYEDERGQCPIADWLKELDRSDNKECRSMLKKIYFQIERLQNEGLGVGEPLIKRLDEDIWELRPIPNRIFFGAIRGKSIVLLHHYRKQSQKTPRQEIDRAKREYQQWLKRGENR